MAVSGLLLHSFADFNLQIPANALLFLMQAYLVTSPPVAAETPPPRIRRRARGDLIAESEALNSAGQTGRKCRKGCLPVVESAR